MLACTDIAIVSSLTDGDEEWICAVLHVFGQVPELWNLEHNSEGASTEAGRKGKRKAHEPFEVHSHYTPHSILLTPQPTSIASHAPAPISHIDNFSATAARFPAEQALPYPSHTAAGESQAWWCQGPPSLSAGHPPSVPGSSPQSQFVNLPSHPAIPPASVQDAPIFPSHIGPSASTENLPHPPFTGSEFDLSELATVLQLMGETFSLPAIGDLGAAATILRDPTDYAVATSGFQTLSKDVFIDRRDTLLSSHNLAINEVLRYLVQWHEWYLDFQNNAAFFEIPISSDFQAELDKMVELRNFLALVYVCRSGGLP